MDSRQFDELTRTLASRTSRRTLLRGIAGGALAAFGLQAGAAPQADKVDICHYDADSGTYHMINVSRNALDAHLAHGDFTECEGNFDVDDSCTCVCALTCDAGLELNSGTCTCDPIPTVGISFRTAGDFPPSIACHVDVSMSNFDSNTTYEVSSDTADAADGTGFLPNRDFTVETDLSGAAAFSDFGESAKVATGGYIQYTIGDFVTPWTLIDCAS